MDLTGFQPLGRFPSRGGAGATITGYNQGTGVVSGLAAPGVLVVLVIAGVYSTSTLADSSGRWSIATSGIGGQSVAVAAVPIGTIVSPSAPGSQTFSNAGTQSFVVPNYRTLIVELNGPGGGGLVGSATTDPVVSGSTSVSSLNLIAGGGGPGRGSNGTSSGGVASGGDTNTAGNGSTSATGGSSPNGGSGGVYANSTSATNGRSPGGGGGSTPGTFVGAGGGAYVKKTIAFGSAGYPVPGSTLSVVVGAKGIGARNETAIAGDGGDGQAKFAWS